MSIATKVDTIIDGLRTRIQAGEFGQDGRLPSFRKLVAEYETSQETMNKAMQALQAEGILVSSGVKGVFVNDSRLRMPGVFIYFSQYLEEHGLKPVTEFIEKPTVIVPSNEIRKRLKLKKDEQVFIRKRKQGTEQQIFRIVEDFFPASLMTDEMLEEAMKNPDYNILLAIKEKFGLVIEHSAEELIARLPNEFEQQHLKIVRTNPVISTKINNFTKDKKIVINVNDKVLNANHFLLTYENNIDYWK